MEFKLASILEGVKNVAVAGHVNPDGDCTGSSMGLFLYMKEQFPQIAVDVYLEKIPASYHILQDTDQIKQIAPKDQSYDLFICVDCDENRLGFSAPLFHQAKKTLCVDHHVSNGSQADVKYIMPDASSTCELVYTMLEAKRITRYAAEAIYLGIAHDTGVFRYPSTSPTTLEIVAELLRKGVNGSEITTKTFFEKTFAQNQILGKALFESRLILDKRCIVTVVSQQDMRTFGIEKHDLDGIVSLLQMTQGVAVAIFLYELQEQQYKISLRSTDQVDVSIVGQHFGGGGHVRASGITMTGSSREIIEQLSEQILKQLS